MEQVVVGHRCVGLHRPDAHRRGTAGFCDEVGSAAWASSGCHATGRPAGGKYKEAVGGEVLETRIGGAAVVSADMELLRPHRVF